MGAESAQKIGPCVGQGVLIGQTRLWEDWKHKALYVVCLGWEITIFHHTNMINQAEQSDGL